MSPSPGALQRWRSGHAASATWYLIIGLAKTGAGYLLYSGLVLGGCRPQVALVIAYIVIGVTGYWGHARLAFGEQGWWKLVRYSLVNAAMWAVNAGLLHLLLELGMGPVAAQGICYAVTVPAGYVVLRWWVFG